MKLNDRELEMFVEQINNRKEVAESNSPQSAVIERFENQQRDWSNHMKQMQKARAKLNSKYFAQTF